MCLSTLASALAWHQGKGIAEKIQDPHTTTVGFKSPHRHSSWTLESQRCGFESRLCYLLCDLGQGTEPAWASVSSSTIMGWVVTPTHKESWQALHEIMDIWYLLSTLTLRITCKLPKSPSE